MAAIAHDERGRRARLTRRFQHAVEGVEGDLEIALGDLRAEVGPQFLDDLVALQHAPALGQEKQEKLAGFLAPPLRRCDFLAAAPGTERAQRLHAQLVAGMQLDARQSQPRQQAFGQRPLTPHAARRQQQRHDPPRIGWTQQGLVGK